MTTTKTTKNEIKTFADLQKAMQIKKEKAKDPKVKFTMRNAEMIYDSFKNLETDWFLEITDEIIEVAGRIFVKATATAINGDEKHSSNALAELDTVPVFSTGNKQMSQPQWTGAVSSYARKYALQGLFAIGEADVDEVAGEIDLQATQQKPQQSQPVPNSERRTIENGLNIVAENLAQEKGTDRVSLLTEKFGEKGRVYPTEMNKFSNSDLMAIGTDMKREIQEIRTGVK